MTLTEKLLSGLLEQGLNLHQNRQWVQAVEVYDAILSKDPEYFDALILKGMIAFQFKDHELALDLWSHAVRIKPDHPDALNNMGLVLHELNREQEALPCFSKAIALKPDFAEAWCNQGNVLRDQHHHGLAVDSYDKAIEHKNDLAVAHCNRGVALRALNRTEESLASLDRAIEIQPDLAQAHNNRGNLLKELQRFDEALSSLDQAIALAPEMAQAHINRGNLMQEMLEWQEAFNSYRKAIELEPHEADGFWNTSLLLLLLGEYELGWQLYEWRWKLKGFTSSHRQFEKPLWSGQETLEGKTILLHAEQGLGDAIQFCRYAKWVKGLGARVILEVPEALLDVSSQIEGVDQAMVKGQTLPEHDLHCPLMSLPLAFKTSLNDIPSPSPYIPVDRLKSDIWRVRLGSKSKPRVGLVWSGGKSHRYDYKRSMSLNQMLDALPAGIDCHSLQQSASATEQAELTARGVSHHGTMLNDFSDTAALCDHMDLIISVDTSVAHLSAAIGKPTWLLLPCVPDWRWLLDRPDSPWYQTMTLYRQDRTRSWAGVMQRVRDDLMDHLKTTKR